MLSLDIPDISYETVAIEEANRSRTSKQLEIRKSTLLENFLFPCFRNSSQSPNLFWQADMREEGKEFRSDLLEEDDESKMKFNKLMSENLNTGGPRYVYDGSDDEDGGDDYDDDDDTY